MLIDVIIPTFNRSQIVKRAIESVLNQSFKQFQLYIIDDGSTDDTELQMAQYEKSPNIHFLKKINSGVSAARNLGIIKSKSDWITFLDSDDEWLPHKLDSQVKFISQNPQLRFVHSNEIWIRNGQRVNAKKKFDKSNQDIFKRSLETCLISPSTVMIKRDLCLEHSMFDEEFVVCEDYDLWIKILSNEKIGFIPDYLVKKYGGHQDQLSTTYPGMDYWRIKSMINLIQKGNLPEDKLALLENEIKKKAPLLLSGSLKHQNHEMYAKLTELLQKLTRR